MDEHGTVPLEVPVHLTETPNGWRAETFGIVAEASSDSEALRRLELHLRRLFLGGATFAADTINGLIRLLTP
jgi:hypothetical protein